MNGGPGDKIAKKLRVMSCYPRRHRTIDCSAPRVYNSFVFCCFGVLLTGEVVYYNLSGTRFTDSWGSWVGWVWHLFRLLPEIILFRRRRSPSTRNSGFCRRRSRVALLFCKSPEEVCTTSKTLILYSRWLLVNNENCVLSVSCLGRWSTAEWVRLLEINQRYTNHVLIIFKRRSKFNFGRRWSTKRWISLEIL